MKPVKNYEELYSVTKDGRVWSHTKRYGRGNPLRKGKWLKIRLHNKRKNNNNQNKYLITKLCKDNKHKTALIHRLIAQAYIPNPDNKPQINHKNGIKNDNRIENLEWCTNLENQVHARRNGIINQKGENGPNTKLTWEQVNEIRKNHISKDIYKRKPWNKYKIHSSHYYQILNMKIWKLEE